MSTVDGARAGAIESLRLSVGFDSPYPHSRGSDASRPLGSVEMGPTTYYGEEESKGFRPPPPSMHGVTIGRAADEWRPPVQARNVTVLPASAFDGLKNLDNERISSIFCAESADKAAEGVGWGNKILDSFVEKANEKFREDPRSLLGRFLNFVVSVLRDNSAHSQDAARTLFHTVHDKGDIEAFHALRDMIRPEERHLFRLNAQQNADGDWHIEMLAGDLTLFRRENVPNHAPERRAFTDAQRTAEISDDLTRRDPGIDAEAELRYIHATGDFRSVVALRDRLASVDPTLVEVTANSSNDGWHYQVKVGNRPLFCSRLMLDDDFLTDAERGQLTGRNPLTAAQTQALYHKLENGMLAVETAVQLSSRPRDEDDIPELGELEVFESRIRTVLADKATTWEKLAAVAAYIESDTDSKGRTSVEAGRIHLRMDGTTIATRELDPASGRLLAKDAYLAALPARIPEWQSIVQAADSVLISDGKRELLPADIDFSKLSYADHGRQYYAINLLQDMLQTFDSDDREDYRTEFAQSRLNDKFYCKENFVHNVEVYAKGEIVRSFGDGKSEIASGKLGDVEFFFYAKFRDSSTGETRQLKLSNRGGMDAAPRTTQAGTIARLLETARYGSMLELVEGTRHSCDDGAFVTLTSVEIRNLLGDVDKVVKRCNAAYQQLEERLGASNPVPRGALAKGLEFALLSEKPAMDYILAGSSGDDVKSRLLEVSTAIRNRIGDAPLSIGSMTFGQLLAIDGIDHRLQALAQPQADVAASAGITSAA